MGLYSIHIREGGKQHKVYMVAAHAALERCPAVAQWQDMEGIAVKRPYHFDQSVELHLSIYSFVLVHPQIELSP